MYKADDTSHLLKIFPQDSHETMTSTQTESGGYMLDELDADNIVVLRSNPVYRIGDVVRRTGLRWKHDRNQILGRNEFKDSIFSLINSSVRWNP